jgi:uncharacterized protein (TIGR02594 family)
MTAMNELTWMRIARSYLGTREIKGPVNNPAIVELFKLVGHGWVKDDETAWCAAFVGGVLAKAGLPHTGSLAARSYEAWGQALPLNQPVYGAIGVKKRSGKNAPAWQGHVGFVVGASADKIILLGGNQNDQVSVASFEREEFTAFRYPAKVSLPKPAYPLPASVAGAVRASEA